MAKPKDQKIYLTKESVSSLYHEGGHYSARLFDAPALFLVNRQCYAETRSMHKRKVTLVIVNAKIPETYVRRMGYIKRSLVTDFLLYSSGSSGRISALERLDWKIELHGYYKNASLAIGFDAEGPDSSVQVGKAKVLGGAIEDSVVRHYYGGGMRTIEDF